IQSRLTSAAGEPYDGYLSRDTYRERGSVNWTAVDLPAVAAYSLRLKCLPSIAGRSYIDIAIHRAARGNVSEREEQPARNRLLSVAPNCFGKRLDHSSKV